MNRPPKSPYLSTIEYLCDALQKGVKSFHTATATLTELWTDLADVW